MEDVSRVSASQSAVPPRGKVLLLQPCPSKEQSRPHISDLSICCIPHQAVPTTVTLSPSNITCHHQDKATRQRPPPNQTQTWTTPGQEQPEDPHQQPWNDWVKGELEAREKAAETEEGRKALEEKAKAYIQKNDDEETEAYDANYITVVCAGAGLFWYQSARTPGASNLLA
jgi:hypothetical protein